MAMLDGFKFAASRARTSLLGVCRSLKTHEALPWPDNNQHEHEYEHRQQHQYNQQQQQKEQEKTHADDTEQPSVIEQMHQQQQQQQQQQHACNGQPILPPEIEELVFDQLDRTQLAVCAAVCTRWHRRLQPRVYQDIEWMDVRRLIRLVKGLEASFAWRRAQLALLDAPQTPTIGTATATATATHSIQTNYFVHTNPLVHIRRLNGWFEPHSPSMVAAHEALAIFCDILITKSPPAHLNITTIFSDSNFVSESTLIRLVSFLSKSNTALVEMRLCGVTATLMTNLSIVAPQLKRLELSSEREEFRIASATHADIVFPSLEHLSITSTSERPRYSLLTIESFETPVLQRLELYFVHITDLALHKLLLRNRICLNSFAIGYVTGPSDTGLGAVPFLCPKVRSLEYTYTNISDVGLDHLARHTDQIEQLVLVGNHQITDVGMIVAARAWRHSLKSLDIGMMRITDAAIKGVMDTCTHLAQLRLRQLQQITDAAITSIPLAPYAASLKSIEFRQCEKVSLDALIKSMSDPRLCRLRECIVSFAEGSQLNAQSTTHSARSSMVSQGRSIRGSRSSPSLSIIVNGSRMQLV